MGNLGTTEIILIALVLLLIVGGSKLTDLGRSLGESQRELKKVKKEYEEIKKEIKDPSSREVSKGQEVQNE